ncbi:MAG TPA: type II toxin-antitoxin system Phd/YefM family antitoxin [Rhizomicrobium sp.]|jgi:prevent-host-death family protein|nr:type II toxin-antitoxin system Phd/YefM family antitoxin [Rhizomicrobium sp.]
MDDNWPVQDAKARFSEMLRASENGPQHITLRGEEKAVLISAEEYRRLRSKHPQRTLYEIWKSAPKVPEFKLPPRKRERMRKVEF